VIAEEGRPFGRPSCFWIGEAAGAEAMSVEAFEIQ
jgi:hypothetical protein